MVCYIASDNRNNRNTLLYTNVFLESGLAMFKYSRKTKLKGIKW